MVTISQNVKHCCQKPLRIYVKGTIQPIEFLNIPTNPNTFIKPRIEKYTVPFAYRTSVSINLKDKYNNINIIGKQK